MRLLFLGTNLALLSSVFIFVCKWSCPTVERITKSIINTRGFVSLKVPHARRALSLWGVRMCMKSGNCFWRWERGCINKISRGAKSASLSPCAETMRISTPANGKGSLTAAKNLLYAFCTNSTHICLIFETLFKDENCDQFFLTLVGHQRNTHENN
jgi:hypothetical protein